MSKPLWTPSETRIQNSNIFKYMKAMSNNIGREINSYSDLYDWSVEDIEGFWESIWNLSEIIHSGSYEKVLDERKMPGAKWFEGTQLNFAENLLRFKDDKIALISIRENNPAYKLTYIQLHNLVARCADGLKNLGVKEGDRVAAFITNIPEAVIGMLAATSLGAVWSSCSPDFGYQGVLDRFGQIKPKVLFAVEQYSYSGKKINCLEKINQIADSITEIQSVILIPEFEDLSRDHLKVEDKQTKYLYFNQLINSTSTKIEFNRGAFDRPVYIMYSSGTTGKPKCIVHGAGGTLLQHFKEHYLHCDLKREDTISYFTTCGWMMWNWLVSSLQLGASVFLYDGNPAYPDTKILWKLTEEHGISIFGTSPKFISHCQNSGIVPKNDFDLSSLKVILSTGSPLSTENFNWIYENVNEDVQLSSISGGTDIISCFMLGNPVLPVYSGEIQCRGLGMKVETFDENGNRVLNEKGELVCTAPFPSMPVFFWDDEKNEKYSAAYFDHYPGIWRHGDFIKITDSGGVIVYGRSDATLNPGGVRIGTAEIYRIVENLDEVSDSLVVGQNYNNDVRIILFVVLRAESVLNEDIKQKIKTAIRKGASPRHVPSLIIQVKEIPYTLSGKKVELAVTRILNGQSIENKDALANPSSLEQFKNLPETENNS